MKNSNKVLTLAFVAVTFLLASCGGGGNDNLTENQGTGTGSMNFSLVFEAPSGAVQQAQSTTRNKQIPQSSISPAALTGNVCTDYGLSTITGGVYNSANALIATGGPWPCSAHQGTFNNIPVGSGYKVVFEADVSGTIAWRGQTTGQSIISGQATTLPPIVMNYIGSDTVPPTVNSVTPVATSTNVPVTSAITATFSEDMLALLVDVATFTLYNGSIPVLGTVSYDVATKTGTFRPSANLAYATSYTATIVGGVTGVKDKALNNMQSNYTWTFTTEAAPVAVPAAPTGVSVTYQSSNIWNYITWNASSGATSYKVYWSTQPGVTKSSSVMPQTSTTDFAHSGVVGGYTYYYCVSALNSVGESALSSEASSITPSGLVAYYPFSGNANDASGNGNHGTVNGATLTTDRFGNANSAYNFNGSSSSIAINSVASAISGHATGAISLWFKAESSASQNYLPLITFYAGTTYNPGTNEGYFALGPYSSQFTTLSIGYWFGENNYDSFYANGSRFFYDNQWHHAVITVDAANSSASGIYIDGQKVNLSNGPRPGNSMWGTFTTATIGKRIYDSWVFQGALDDVRIYNRALSAAEVQGLYQLPASDTWQTMSTTGAPAARGFHSAVWTGSEMIIWGGYLTPTTQTNTGGRYNPVTDSWGTPTSTVGAPSAREGHTAVWTGSEMIVWGGSSASIHYNNGGRYNPATDSWSATPPTTTGAPSARSAHSAVWTGNEMIIWGGHTGTAATNDGGRYNPTTNTWNSTAMSTTGAPDLTLSSCGSVDWD